MTVTAFLPFFATGTDALNTFISDTSADASNDSESAIDYGDAGEARADEGMLTSLPALRASDYFTDDTAAEPCKPAMALPERITPENAHEFPALLKEIEQLEETVNRAKDPWARGVVSMFILVHSGKFHEYVTQNGRLSPAGREFLSTIKGDQREIDPAVVPAPPAAAASPPKASAAPAARPLPAPQPIKKPDPVRPNGRESDAIDELALRAAFDRLFPKRVRGYMTTSDETDDSLDVVRAALADPRSRKAAMEMLEPHRTSEHPLRRRTVYECIAGSRGQTALDWFAQGLADADGSNCHFARHMLTERALDPKSSMRAQYAVADMLFQENRFARGHAASLFESISTLEALFVCDRLVAALRYQEIAGPLSRALVNAARRIDTRLFVYQALLQGLASPDINVRANTGSIIVKLLGDDKVDSNTEQWLLKSAEDRDPLVRAGIALAFGRAAKDGRILSRNERETLATLARDRDARVREQAAWALEQVRDGSDHEAALPNVAEQPDTPRTEVKNEGTQQPRAIEEQLVELRKGRDDAKWNKDRPALVATLCKLPPEQRMEAVRETLMHKSEFFGPMRIAEAYADIAALIPLTPGELVFLLERRATGWSELRNNLDLALSAARTVQVRGRFLSRDAYFEVMKRALGGAYGDAVKGGAQRLLDLAARNNDLRARDLLNDQDKTSEPSPSPARDQQKTTPDTTKTAPLVLDPQELLKMFQDGLDGLSEFRPHLRAWLDAASRDAEAAKEIWKTVQRIVELAQDDEVAMYRIVGACLERFLEADVLTQNSVELLLELRKRFRGGSVGDMIAREWHNYLSVNPKVGLIAQAAQGAPTPADPYLDPAKLAKVFDQGHHINMGPVNELLDYARTGPAEARAATRAMWQAVELLQGNDFGLLKIVRFGLREFAREHLLGEEDYQQLLILGQSQRPGSEVNNDIESIFRMASMDPEKMHALVRAKQALERRQSAGAQGTPAPSTPPQRTPDTRFNPQGLANLFQGGTYSEILANVDGMLSLARSDRDMAREAMAAMWQAVEIANGDLHTLICLNYHFFGRFAEANLVTQDDWEQLLRLGERYPDVAHEISLMTRDKRSVSPRQAALIAAAQAAMQSPQQPAARGAVSTPPRELQGSKGPAAFADMPPERRKRIESLVDDLLHGDTKARKKAAAEWAKFVGERNAGSHAWPMLVLALSSEDEKALEAAVPFLANAIAKDTNWPEKKRDLLNKALASSDPRVRAGASMVLAALGAASAGR